MAGSYLNIEEETKNNVDYRRIIYTDDNIQIALMNLQEGEDIPEEVHDGTQFIRVESGEGEAIVGGKIYPLYDGISITIPRQTKHYVRNTSKDALTLYSIYSPPEHTDGLIEHKQHS